MYSIYIKYFFYTEDSKIHRKRFQMMKYFFLCFFVPTMISFLVQSILCHKMKKGFLRYGGLTFTIIAIVSGVVTLLTQCRDIFGGFGMIATVLWFATACHTAFGYGMAWFIFFISKNKKNRKIGTVYEEKNSFVYDSWNDGPDRMFH